MIAPPCALLGERRPPRPDQPPESASRRVCAPPQTATSKPGVKAGRPAADEVRAMQKLLRDTARYFGLRP